MKCAIEVVKYNESDPSYGYDIHIDKGPLTNTCGDDYAYWIEERLGMHDKTIIKELDRIVEVGVAYKKLRIICSCKDDFKLHTKTVISYVEDEINRLLINVNKVGTGLKGKYKNRQVDSNWWGG